MSHTPGPWHIGEAYECFCVFASWNIHPITKGLDVKISGSRRDGPVCIDIQTEANARLIAAAPELLDSLRILYEETADYIRINHLGDVHHNRSMQYARDTIAKAESKT